MKTFALLLLIIGSNVTLAVAQTSTSTNVVLAVINFSISTNLNYPVNANQIIQWIGGPTPPKGGILGSSLSLNIGQTYTGLTNINLSVTSGNLGYATFQITTPVASTGTVVTNSYIPADCVVLPSNTSGNCTVILESSIDLLNWTAANPGLYGPTSATNRFFRVRISCP